MSRPGINDPKASWMSQTSFASLNVESGEETEEEVEDVSSSPEVSNEPSKPTKSALKKAKALARAEKRQQEKAARAAARVQATATPPPPAEESSQTPAELAEAEETVSEDDAPPGSPANPVPVFDEGRNQSRLTSVVEDAAPPPASETNGSAHLKEEKKSEAVKAKAGFKEDEESVASSSEAEKPQHTNLASAPAEVAKAAVNGHATEVILEKTGVVNAQDAEKAKKISNALTRTLWTFIMIGGFILLLLMGHAYMILLVMLCQTLVYREVTALFSLKRHSDDPATNELSTKPRGRDPWSKTLNWYFFAVANYYLYGESIIYYFKHVVFSDAQLASFATNHRITSFSLYTLGFVGFVLSLRRGYLKQQFGLFCWVHMTLLFIVVSSHFIMNNILEGMIWFWVPASLVICNDVFAYVWGVTVGRTPLIQLSPKKTVEGFIGAFFSTVLFSVVWGTYFMQFDYMICPTQTLGVSAFDGTISCRPNPVFVWRDWSMPEPMSMFLSTLFGRSVTSIPYAPYQLHLLVLACFASLVAPFGGFFASGFKRAFNIKDFGHSIPGHGGMTDRMDCQFLMGVFTYVYYSSLIRQLNVTVGSILQTIVSGLTVQEQLELLSSLKGYLETQGISVNI